MPLADTYRPTSFDEMIGQQHLVGSHGILRHMADTASIQSMIFYGPPGTGKTTAALILAGATDKPLYKLNAVNASTSDIKKIAEKTDDHGCVLYLDEIQYFNKKQQQSLLPYVESGVITLIASTTENPYHDIYDAILSRCTIVEFKRITADDIAHKLASIPEACTVPTQVITFIAQIASGDVRHAYNTLELVLNRYQDTLDTITIDDVRVILPTAQMAGFDTHGNNHYQYISALQKSIRGSDPDAAVFWLTKLLEGGDIISPCRRLPAICCEDIGLADPHAIEHTMACIHAAEMLGLPEAYKPLTQAVLYLALAPKCASNEPAWMGAREDIRAGRGATVPAHIASEHAPDYIWPQDQPHHWVNQQYLPDDLIDRHYWIPQDNQFEQERYGWWWHVRHNAGVHPNPLPPYQPRM